MNATAVVLSAVVLAGLVALAAAAWPVAAGAAVEEPAYEVLEQDGAFELRRYPALLAAETTVTGADFESAGDVAFGRLFRYISGNNAARREIAMTAPVVQERGTEIAMTAPVVQSAGEGGYRVAFLVPSAYTAETVPRPLDPAVSIRATPERLVAALRYSGSWSERNWSRHEEELRAGLAPRGLVADGEAIIARYDAPFMPWPLRRNEVLIPVRRDAGGEAARPD